MARNPLEEYFHSNHGRRIDKWAHYFDVYQRHFEKFRNTPVVVVEIGVWDGGSLQMWRDYFGTEAKIYGIDIDPRCVAFESAGTRVLIGDQADRPFLQSVISEIGPIDIVIDDGGHYTWQQIVSFQELYPAIKPGGVYLVEDLHTNYWPEYSGGFRLPTTFVEYAKTLYDQLNAWHSRGTPGLEVDQFTLTTRSMHLYDSIIAFEKDVIEPPQHEITGTEGA